MDIPEELIKKISVIPIGDWCYAGITIGDYEAAEKQGKPIKDILSRGAYICPYYRSYYCSMMMQHDGDYLPNQNKICGIEQTSDATRLIESGKINAINPDSNKLEEDKRINEIIERHIKSFEGHKYLCLRDLPEVWHTPIMEFMNSDRNEYADLDVPSESEHRRSLCFRPIQIIEWLKWSGGWRNA